jgi:RNA polymerase sigma-54 factor
MLTPKGIFELKYFFCSALNNKNGATHASTAIRAHIKNLIHEEASFSPLSDQKITEHLLSKGIRIARRTVTKYRESMKIPSAQQRKILE